MKQNDLVVVVLRKRPSLARYVEIVEGRTHHVVNSELRPEAPPDLRIVPNASVIELSRQPEVRT